METQPLLGRVFPQAFPGFSEIVLTLNILYHLLFLFHDTKQTADTRYTFLVFTLEMKQIKPLVIVISQCHLLY